MDIFKLFRLMIKAFIKRGPKAGKICLVYFLIFQFGPGACIQKPASVKTEEPSCTGADSKHCS